MVYVLNIDGKPLMPTERHGKVRRLLRDGEAKVIKCCPFTIQLLYETTDFVQEVSLGVDAGSKYIGISATTKDTVLYESEIRLRNDIVDLLSTRRALRRTRRNRLRYRKPRFNNRVRTKHRGWLAPSVEQKIQTHLSTIEKVYKILPVSKIIIEVASFDIQRIKDPDIKSKEYQQGEQAGSWNVREYVLRRDDYTCQCCNGASGDSILMVHHIESRKTGGNSPNNLITLCKTCHEGYHRGKINLPFNIKRGMKFNDATFMNIMRPTLCNRLQEMYSNVYITYGYITKNIRIENKLPKSHRVDARCISGNPTAKPLDYYFYQKKVRCHNRQIHKAHILHGGIRKENQAPYVVKGFRLFDKVLFEKKEYFIFGRRLNGYFDIRDLFGNKVNNGSISYKKLTLVEKRKHFLMEIISNKRFSYQPNQQIPIQYNTLNIRKLYITNFLSKYIAVGAEISIFTNGIQQTDYSFCYMTDLYNICVTHQIRNTVPALFWLSDNNNTLYPYLSIATQLNNQILPIEDYFILTGANDMLLYVDFNLPQIQTYLKMVYDNHQAYLNSGIMSILLPSTKPVAPI